MGILDWTFVLLISSALLFVLFAGFSFFLSVSTGKKARKFKRKPPKNKQKRKKFLAKRRILEKQRRHQQNVGVLFIICMLLTGGSAFYSRYYQMTNLEAGDSEAIVQSYYLIDEIQGQLINLKNGTNPEKSIKNLREVSSRLASYGVRRPYQGLTEDGQKVLTRHFALMKNLGVNLASQSVESLTNPEIMESYVTDVNKIKESQKRVFEEFKVNESALKQKK
ncbi:hypothetical protein [Enterococcus crotali]|uniref:hypothetical protein n=1 Tax=Enterococcus crotali TaxID=1453587 RepID=UPI000471DDD1|nr:hypothetical protein [Enterococcus crotali]